MYSKRVENMRASEVRELLKLTESEGIISFSGGMPDPALFPKRELAEIVEGVVKAVLVKEWDEIDVDTPMVILD